jgi:hypothetical protein
LPPMREMMASRVAGEACATACRRRRRDTAGA